MLITATILIGLYILAAALAIGGLTTRNEALLTFGAALFILSSYVVFTNGMAIPTGSQENTTYTIEGNTTTGETKTTDFIYEENKGFLSQSIAAVSLLLGAALFFYIYDIQKKEKNRFLKGE